MTSTFSEILPDAESFLHGSTNSFHFPVKSQHPRRASDLTLNETKDGPELDGSQEMEAQLPENLCNIPEIPMGRKEVQAMLFIVDLACLASAEGQPKLNRLTQPVEGRIYDQAHKTFVLKTKSPTIPLRQETQDLKALQMEAFVEKDKQRQVQVLNLFLFLPLLPTVLARAEGRRDPRSAARGDEARNPAPGGAGRGAAGERGARPSGGAEREEEEVRAGRRCRALGWRRSRRSAAAPSPGRPASGARAGSRPSPGKCPFRWTPAPFPGMGPRLRERQDGRDGKGTRGTPQIRRWRRADRGAGFLFPALSLPDGGQRGWGSAPPPRPRPPLPTAAWRGRPAAATARLQGSGPEPRCSPPSIRSRGGRSVRSLEKRFLSALGTVTKSTLQLKRDSPRTGPEHPPPSVRSRRGYPLLAPRTVDRGGSRRPRLCGAFGLEGLSLCR
ncbi:unnamed protein product [Rangifer tarandus platyrhynchus]|uniref:Uncharacterized protein n=2 Tax=Rangifer tarandus platyrhynchus TaxID=3082113 RepID=A0ACB0F635_RANTA|nr:unnamed protein product [Rangifer tarandus platyrhynchus]CAI9708177.1 unnamed protein product [Rangifer tarandus platyrhynchus]